MKIVLASASPRRSMLLDQLQIQHRVHAVNIDESALVGESGRGYVERLAREKAKAALRVVEKNSIVIAADTTVVLDGEIIGKPVNQDDFICTFSKLAGRKHNVMTAICVAVGQWEKSCCVDTQVQLRKVTKEEMLCYWQTGEPVDKAGGYAIQGIGAMFIEAISGSYSSVVGLPLMELSSMLAAAGCPVLTNRKSVDN